MLSGHLHGALHCTVRTLFTRGENDFGAEDLEHLAAFDRHAGGHEDLDGVTLDARDGRQGDTGVARRRFEDGLTRQQATRLFGFLDHRLGDAVLHRSEGVLHLELGEDAHVRVGRQAAHVDHGRVADEVEHAFVPVGERMRVTVTREALTGVHAHRLHLARDSWDLGSGIWDPELKTYKPSRVYQGSYGRDG